MSNTKTVIGFITTILLAIVVIITLCSCDENTIDTEYKGENEPPMGMVVIDRGKTSDDNFKDFEYAIIKHKTTGVCYMVVMGQSEKAGVSTTPLYNADGSLYKE